MSRTRDPADVQRFFAQPKDAEQAGK